MDLNDPWQRSLVRLSFLMRCPLHELLRWPMWVLRTYAQFSAREPTVEERVELSLARLHLDWSAVHRQADAPAPQLREFLHFRDAWGAEDSVVEEEGGYSSLDLEYMQLFAGGK